MYSLNIEKSIPHGTDRFHIAYFVTPHGFGHAARAAAVMSALSMQNPSIHFDIFTQVPEWFFKASLADFFTYHSLFCDIGLIQNNPLQEDLATTLKYLDAFLPFDQSQVHNLANYVSKELQCKIVICDIAPLGIAVAQAADLPSFLIENFTWDWIYQGYLDIEKGFSKFIPILQDSFSSADYHIQVEPVCISSPDAILTTSPVSRKPVTPREIIRGELGISQDMTAALITMGGIQSEFNFLDQLTKLSQIYFIIPGSSQTIETHDNLALLPHQSKFFHPDLINASDVVIGKVGYSTVAEVFHAGIPFGCIPRPLFPESDILITYIMENNPCVKISPEEFLNGAWADKLFKLQSMNPILRQGLNGADQIARYINEFINNQE